MRLRFRTIGLLAACLACALSGAAGAQEAADEYYAGFFDYYYHAHPRCALARTVAALSREEAEAQGKYPCPVCVNDETKYDGVASTVRGGTLVIRVPDAWMADRPASEVGDNLAHFEELRFEDREAEAALAEQLHGAGYRAFLDALAQDGRAVTGNLSDLVHARTPDVSPADGALMMHRRHIGSAWYLVYRPEEAARKRLEKKDRLDLDLYFTVNTLAMSGGGLSVFPGGLWEDADYTLKPKKSKNKTLFTVESDDLTLSVYGDMDANICVVHQDAATPEALEGAILLIDGADNGIRLRGYADGWEGIFCGVLTDAEAVALKGGAKPALKAAP